MNQSHYKNMMKGVDRQNTERTMNGFGINNTGKT